MPHHRPSPVEGVCALRQSVIEQNAMSLLSVAIVDPACVATAAPPLGVLLYQHFTYGFLTVLLTKRFGLSNLGWAIASSLVANIGWHFADSAQSRLDFIVFSAIFFILGTIPGAALSTAGRFPRLLNLDVLRTYNERHSGQPDRRPFSPEPLLLWTAAIFGFLGASFLAHRWSMNCLLVNPTTETIVGAVFVGLAGLIIFGLCYYAYCPVSRKRGHVVCDTEGYIIENKRRLKYMVIFVLLSSVPHLIIDFSFLGGFTVYYGAVAVGALAVTYLLMYFLAVFWSCTWKPYKERLVSYDGLESRHRVRTFVLATGIYHCLALLTIYITELLTDHSLVYGSVAALAVAVIGACIFPVVTRDLRRVRTHDKKKKEESRY